MQKNLKEAYVSLKFITYLHQSFAPSDGRRSHHIDAFSIKKIEAAGRYPCGFEDSGDHLEMRTMQVKEMLPVPKWVRRPFNDDARRKKHGTYLDTRDSSDFTGHVAKRFNLRLQLNRRHICRSQKNPATCYDLSHDKPPMR